MLGSLAAWWLLRQGADVRQVIEWSVVPGVVAFVVLAVVLPGPAAGHGQATSHSRPRLPTPDSRLRLLAFVLALTALTFFRLPETLLILRLQDLGVAVAAIPLVWAGLHVVRSASSYPGGWLADRLGPRRMVAAGGLLFAGVALALGGAVGSATATALFLTFGLVAGLTESGERSIVSRLAPVRTGRGFGIYHGLTGGSGAPGGPVFGALYQSVSGRTAPLGFGRRDGGRGPGLAGDTRVTARETAHDEGFLAGRCSERGCFNRRGGAGAGAGGRSATGNLFRAARGTAGRNSGSGFDAGSASVPSLPRGSGAGCGRRCEEPETGTRDSWRSPGWLS